MNLKMSSAKWWPFCLSLSVLNDALLPVRCQVITWSNGTRNLQEHISVKFELKKYISRKGIRKNCKTCNFVQISMHQLVFVYFLHILFHQQEIRQICEGWIPQQSPLVLLKAGNHAPYFRIIPWMIQSPVTGKKWQNKEYVERYYSMA